jgi:hypothetical protein
MFDISFFHKFISNLSKRERIVLYTTIIFVSLALLDRLVVSPAFTKMAMLNDEVEEQKLIIKKSLHFLSLKDIIDVEAKKYSVYFSEEGSPDEEMNSLLKLIEDFARQTNVDLLYIKPAGFKSEEGHRKYYIDLNCQGGMPEVINFLYLIENSKKLLSVEKMNIAPESEGSSVAQCRMTLSKISIH